MLLWGSKYLEYILESELNILHPILRGGAGSHPTPGHVIRKRTVNMTLTKGNHDAQTRCTAGNFLFFHTLVVRPLIIQYYFYDWGG
jgi:hypothetical protein